MRVFGVFMGQCVTGAALLGPAFGCQIAAPLQQIQHFNKGQVFKRFSQNLHGKLPQYVHAARIGAVLHQKANSQPDPLRTCDFVNR